MKKKQGQQQLQIEIDYHKWSVSTSTLWAVQYQGQCIQIRREHTLKTEHKYPGTTSTQRGTALRLARKLNKMFNCSDFTIAEVTPKTTQ